MEEVKIEKQFWKSKKWWVMLTAVVIPVANRALGLDMGMEELKLVIGSLMAYIMGQGIADIGKNK